jgi:hypothetical protein
MTKHIVEELAEACGGTIESADTLPDGSGFATMSLPLPETHWIYETTKDGWSLPPPMVFRMASGLARQRMAEKIWEAGRYAVRGATMNGKAMDFDPDALVQNLVVAMLGYHTEDGLTSDTWANPDPVPPLHNEVLPVSETDGLV